MLIPSFLMSDVNKLLRLLIKNEQCEQIAQVAQQKWANEQMARVFLANRSFALFFAKNERFAQKTDEWIPNLDHESALRTFASKSPNGCSRIAYGKEALLDSAECTLTPCVFQELLVMIIHQVETKDIQLDENVRKEFLDVLMIEERGAVQVLDFSSSLLL